MSADVRDQCRLLEVPRFNVEQRVSEWFAKASTRQRQKPLPLLIVKGAAGSGKTRLVTEVARRAGVRLVHVGSDDAECNGDDDKMRAPLSNDTSLARWHDFVRTRTWHVTVLFFDNAESVTNGTTRARALINLGAHAVPVVMAVSDAYATQALRELDRARKGVERVTLAPVTKREMIALLNRHTNTVSMERKRVIVADSCGDMRRALEALHMDMRAENAVEVDNDDAAVEEPARAFDARASIFDKCNALLGVATSAVPSDDVEQLEAAMHDDADTCARLVVTHYPSVLRWHESTNALAALDTAARVANLIATADTRYGRMQHNLVWRAANLVRMHNVLAPRAAKATKRLAYSGPLDGAGSAALRLMRQRAPDVAFAVMQYDLATLDERGTLDGIQRVSGPSRVDSVDAAMRRVHASRDDIMMLCATTPPEQRLRSLDEMARGFKSVTAKRRCIFGAAPKLKELKRR